jgi:uncharacterized caspase-like protein
MPFLRSVVISLFLCLAAAVSAQAQGKSLNGVALVIGQSAYEHIPALPNPANDAREMLKLLTDLGFDARSVSDRDSRRLGRDLERFVEDAEGADVAFLYYSGHGIEAGGENWLLPVDASAASLNDAEGSLVAVSKIIDELKQTVPVVIVLLDACRTSPFPEGAVIKISADAKPEPVGAGGLTPVRGAAPLSGKPQAADNLGTVIGFAAEPGRPALDGAAGGNSPYASALLRHLGAMDGNEFGAVMRMVTEEVYLDTRAQQRPWMNESLRRMLYFGGSVDQPTGDDATITGERRQLLLTISDLPTANRAQIETVALRDEVPLDALYGVLRAMGTEKIPDDPKDLEQVLKDQAKRVRDMLAERDALIASDPEIARLTRAADRAIREGAILAARGFLDDAVSRVEATSDAVDNAEDLVRQKRIADAAVYGLRADAAALAFDFRSAADDYLKAFELIDRWDDKLAWNYRNKEAEALQSLGDATGDRAMLERAVTAYKAILDRIPRGEEGRDWAITRNNMAVVLQTIGELSEEGKELEEAVAIFRDSLAILEREGDRTNWAAAQNNIGNVLLVLGQRDSDNATLEKALEAFRSTLEARPRDKLPLDWASSQNNIGLTLATLGERLGSPDRLIEAETAYDSALEEYTRAKAPLQWAMVMNNLGNTQNMIGSFRNDESYFAKAIKTFRQALEVRTREHFPLQWASTQMNLGNALANKGRTEIFFGSSQQQAVEAYEAALEVFTREKSPHEWASAQNNLGSILQTQGQKNRDVELLKKSATAFEAAGSLYDRQRLPLDWAMIRNNIGNTYQLIGLVSGDPDMLRKAVASFREALEVYNKGETPRQWALTQNGLGATLQSLANYEEKTDSLRASVEARRAALEILTLDNAPAEWATAQNGLGVCLLNLGNRENEPSYFPDAKRAFEEATKVFTKESQPVQWAFAINNIGDVHWSMGAKGGGNADYEQAITLFESAKEAFQKSGFLQVVPLMDQKIDAIREAMAKK